MALSQSLAPLQLCHDDWASVAIVHARAAAAVFTESQNWGSIAGALRTLLGWYQGVIGTIIGVLLGHNRDAIVILLGH